MRILFSCRAFNNMAGGVERMACIMLEAMRQRGHEMELLTWDSSSASAFYEIHPAIKWYQLDIGNPQEKATLKTRLQRAVRMRQILKDSRPDVILAFQEGTFISTRLYSIGMGTPVIAAERNAPSRFEHISASKYKNLIFQCFRLARAITIQIESYRNSYPAYLHEKIVSIPNPVAEAVHLADPSGEGKKIKTLLSVGRLGYQKNYDALVDAFARIASHFPEWQLVIVGEGEDRNKLEQFISSKGLGDCIKLPGTTTNVGQYYADAQLFCLPSRWEGFPNALAEAMAHGLPAVGFRQCSGVADLIEDGKTGLLAQGNGQADALAETLSQLLADDEKRVVMGKQAREQIAVYKPEAIFDRWEQLFMELSRA